MFVLTLCSLILDGIIGKTNFQMSSYKET